MLFCKKRSFSARPWFIRQDKHENFYQPYHTHTHKTKQITRETEENQETEENHEKKKKVSFASLKYGCR